MKIASSDVTLASSHSFTSQRNVQERTRIWIGDQRPNFEGVKTPVSPVNSPRIVPATDVQISDASKLAQTSEANAIEQAIEAAANDPKIRLILDLISLMLGEDVRIQPTSGLKPVHEAEINTGPASNSHGEAQKAPQAHNQGFGVEYDFHESYQETEHTQFHSSGVIRTADNKEIKFELNFDLQRRFSEESSTHIRQGDAKKIDPIVLNFSGDSVQLTSQKFSFDLDGDGKKENVSFVKGAGFLALDRNGDGKVNDGKELFGPNTGNGFDELKTFDVDHNGWIDENDPVFLSLKVWTKDDAGKDHLASLKESKAGALFLGNVSTEYAINDKQNKAQAQLVSSGLWLTDEGKVNSLQQVDLVA
jgi:hypothetical protein